MGGLPASSEKGSVNGSVVGQVALCAAQAAHRRDHSHPTAAGVCRPHVVEVVHLGQQAVVVCHDCGDDSGFIPVRAAEKLAGSHRVTTRQHSVPLPRPPSE